MPPTLETPELAAGKKGKGVLFDPQGLGEEYYDEWDVMGQCAAGRTPTAVMNGNAKRKLALSLNRCLHFERCPREIEIHLATSAECSQTMPPERAASPAIVEE